MVSLEKADLEGRVQIVDMKISQIKYVLTVLECGSISQAAKKLYISQPSLSGYIINLEKQLGVTLFDRAASPLRLTHAGELYVKTATKILDLSNRLHQELSDLDDTPHGHITVGSSQSMTTYIMPHILIAFKKRFPKIEVSLVEALGYEREEATLKGKIDFFFTTSPIKNEHLQYSIVMSERILLALPPSHRHNHPDAQKRQNDLLLPNLQRRSYPHDPLPPEEDFPLISLEVLQQDSFVMLLPDLSLHKLALDLCKTCGFTPKIFLESRSIDAVRSMAIWGLGNAFIPESIVRYGNFNLHPTYYQIDQLFPARDLYIAYRKDSYYSKAMLEFSNTVLNVLHSPVISECCP
jgi:DNA-binding transcriptional LysR family regulator